MCIRDRIKLTGADRIELYTGPYAVNPTLEVVSQYERAFNHAKDIGLGVNAGHDLDLNNLELFLSKVPVDEVSIGHALISDALISGLEVVTKQFLDVCKCCLLYTSPSPRDRTRSRMPSSA